MARAGGSRWCGVAVVGLLVISCAGAALVSAGESLSMKTSSFNEDEELQSYNPTKIFNFFWQKGRLGYQKIWPEMTFGWRIVLGTIIGFFGAAFGTVGGVGGGGIFVPMLTLIIGFDQKSSTALSKCMITGGALATVFYNLKLRHPTLDTPLIDYDLSLLFQPMLVLGISIGVTLNVILPVWMITILLILIFTTTSTKAFFKGIETWKKETLMKKEAARRLQSAGSENEEVEYKTLPGAPNDETSAEASGSKKNEVSILENVRWRALGLLFGVWSVVLALQIIKNYTATCSLAYWVLNLLQIPATVSVTTYEAVKLYKGQAVLASYGEAVTNWKVHKLFFYSVMGVFAGLIGGMLGLGGGFLLGPLFLEMGLPPQVSSATATFAMTFSASMSVVEYYLLNRFPVPYALYLAAVATVSALVGQHVVRQAIKLLGRTSIIIFILSITIFVSAITLGGVGIANMIRLIEEKAYMGFDDICAST